MSQDPEELKKTLMELDYLFEAAEDADAAMSRVYDRLMKAVTEIAMATYPELKQMESNQIRWFGERMSNSVDDIVRDLDQLSYWIEAPDKFDKEGNLLPHKSQ
jgi:hypothetical protein